MMRAFIIFVFILIATEITAIFYNPPEESASSELYKECTPNATQPYREVLLLSVKAGHTIKCETETQDITQDVTFEMRC